MKKLSLKLSNFFYRCIIIPSAMIVLSCQNNTSISPTAAKTCAPQKESCLIELGSKKIFLSVYPKKLKQSERFFFITHEDKVLKAESNINNLKKASLSLHIEALNMELPHYETSSFPFSHLEKLLPIYGNLKSINPSPDKQIHAIGPFEFPVCTMNLMHWRGFLTLSDLQEKEVRSIIPLELTVTK